MGNTMKNRFLGLLALTLGSAAALASANASDFYVPGGYKDGPCCGPIWTGFYLGAHVGGAWGDLTAVDRDGYNTKVGDHTTLSPSGVFGGLTAGVNWQRGAAVFGFEGDIGGMDLKARRVMPASAALFGGDTSAALDQGAYGDFTARLGYLFRPDILVYGKGGVAMYDGRFRVEDDCSTAPCGSATILATGNRTFLGWTAGGGAEYFVFPRWTVKAEYQFFDFGSGKVKGVTGNSQAGTLFTFDAKDFTASTVKVGFAYHFGGPSYEPFK